MRTCSSSGNISFLFVHLIRPTTTQTSLSFCLRQSQSMIDSLKWTSTHAGKNSGNFSKVCLTQGVSKSNATSNIPKGLNRITWDLYDIRDVRLGTSEFAPGLYRDRSGRELACAQPLLTSQVRTSVGRGVVYGECVGDTPKFVKKENIRV